MPLDVFKRLTPTPHKHSFELGCAVVDVATNHQVLADRLLSEFPPAAPAIEHSPSFAWKVVVENDDDLGDEVGAQTDHMSVNGLALVTIGQKSFFACDLKARMGVSFVSEHLVNDETLFRRYLLPVLISLPKGSMESAL